MGKQRGDEEEGHMGQIKDKLGTTSGSAGGGYTLSFLPLSGKSALENSKNNCDSCALF